jgi:hypothetical protein
MSTCYSWFPRGCCGHSARETIVCETIAMPGGSVMLPHLLLLRNHDTYGAPFLTDTQHGSQYMDEQDKALR